MDTIHVIQTFRQLAQRLEKLSPDDLRGLTDKAYNSNSWFTSEAVISSIEGIVKMLSEDLEQWVGQYNSSTNPKNVGLVWLAIFPLLVFMTFCVY